MLLLLLCAVAAAEQCAFVQTLEKLSSQQLCVDAKSAGQGDANALQIGG